MNKPIKPKEPNKSFAYECYSYFDFNYEQNDIINKKYPFLYLSNVLNNLPEHWKNILKQYNLDLEKYELEMAKYELHLAEEKVKNLEKLYAKT